MYLFHEFNFLLFSTIQKNTKKPLNMNKKGAEAPFKIDIV